MRRILLAALLLSSLLCASQSATPKAATPPLSALRCEALPPFYRSDASKVLKETIGPKAASPTGNSFFMLPRPRKYMVVHLTPTTTDNAAYPVKIITRYTDDTIFEQVVTAIEPKAGQPITWGPLALVPAEVPKDKIPDIVMVKVQENYALQPNAKGFSYTLSVDGCD